MENNTQENVNVSVQEDADPKKELKDAGFSGLTIWMMDHDKKAKAKREAWKAMSTKEKAKKIAKTVGGVAIGAAAAVGTAVVAIATIGSRNSADETIEDPIDPELEGTTDPEEDVPMDDPVEE